MTHSAAPPRDLLTETDYQDWLERARSVGPVLAAHAHAIEAERALPAQVLDAMHSARLFRASLPVRLGGGQLPVPVLAGLTETVAQADASAAWCLGQGLGCAMSSAFLPAAAAEEVFGPDDAVLAWGAGAQGTATALEEGYRVSGQWRFASGGKHATWLGAHCKVFEADGTPRLKPDGNQASRTAVFPRSRATIADDWYVMGLKGTRSEGYSVTDLAVPARHTLDRESPNECQVSGTLYKFPTTSAYASMFSGVALGIARAMLNDLVSLARGKTARGAGTSMRDSAVIQTRLAELEAQLGSARAYQRQEVGDVWREVDVNQSIDVGQRVRIRLATTYAINEATAVTEQVYRLAGSSAIFESGAFERRFRDAHAVSQQVQGRHTNFESVGRHMLGLDPSSIFL